MQKPTQILSMDPNSIDFTTGNLQITGNDVNKLKLTEGNVKEIEDENSGPIHVGVFGMNPVISEADEEVENVSNSSPDGSRRSIPAYFEVRVCKECLIEQPLRSKHCFDCGRCVALYDHHCPWLATCIAEKNRFYFWWYLVFENVLLASTIAYLSLSFSKNSVFWTWALENFLIILSLLTCSLFECLVLFLLTFHTYLATTNKTTWEVLSRSKISYFSSLPPNYNPFTLGLAQNLYFYCCKPLASGYTIWSISGPSS